MTSTRTIFDNTAISLNIVATTEQLNAVFASASREFFSYVYPVAFVSYEKLEEIDLTLYEGYIDNADTLGLGMGNFTVKEYSPLIENVAIRVEPLDVLQFSLPNNYAGAFQYVSEYFLSKVEKENMDILRSSGIDNLDGGEVIDLQQIREYLRREFGVTAVGLVM